MEEELIIFISGRADNMRHFFSRVFYNRVNMFNGSGIADSYKVIDSVSGFASPF
ncbi:hypothetical protein SDC9_122221 [bioreactor metagenome]|uniref:Uncharacterized protein n=1 Tax=bioreactor metagenome TaxID=1076179 RepID=A0A645CEA8_9ZZZZ